MATMTRAIATLGFVSVLLPISLAACDNDDDGNPVSIPPPGTDASVDGSDSSARAFADSSAPEGDGANSLSDAFGAEKTSGDSGLEDASPNDVVHDFADAIGE
jgi:hypothetical protein